MALAIAHTHVCFCPLLSQSGLLDSETSLSGKISIKFRVTFTVGTKFHGPCVPNSIHATTGWTCATDDWKCMEAKVEDETNKSMQHDTFIGLIGR
jgi:hypothetical protein